MASGLGVSFLFIFVQVCVLYLCRLNVIAKEISSWGCFQCSKGLLPEGGVFGPMRFLPELAWLSSSVGGGVKSVIQIYYNEAIG